MTYFGVCMLAVSIIAGLEGDKKFQEIVFGVGIVLALSFLID